MLHRAPADQLGRNHVRGHAILAGVAGVRLPRMRRSRRGTPVESAGVIDLYIDRGLRHAGYRHDRAMRRSAAVLANAGAASHAGVNGAALQPVITGTIGASHAGTAHARAARWRIARAVAANAERRSAAGLVEAATVALVGAAVGAVAVSVPVAYQWSVSSQALAVRAAGIAGPRLAMMRRGVSDATARCRHQRTTPEQSTHESSP
jgi:hypothetical protein